MIKPSMVLLAAVLTAPFGLALHEDLTAEKPKFDTDQWSHSFGGLYGEDSIDEAEEVLARLEQMEDEVLLEANDESEPISRSTLGELFGTGPAVLGPMFADVTFGMTARQVRHEAPDLDPDTLALRSDDFGRLVINLQYEARNETGLSAIRLEIPDIDGSATAFLREQWGEPTIAGDGDSPAIWFNADAGVRAVQFADVPDTLTITVTGAMAPADLFASQHRKKVFGFETQPLIGADIDDLKADYPGIEVDQDYGEYALYELPAISVDPTGLSLTRVTMTIADENVTLVELIVGCGAQCEQVKAAFETKLGAPTRSDEVSNTHTYGKSPKVEIVYPPTGEAGVIEITVAAK